MMMREVEEGAVVAMQPRPVAIADALTKVVAAELRTRAILGNAVCPGWVATDIGGTGGRPVEDGAAGVVWAATLPDDGPGSCCRTTRMLRLSWLAVLAMKLSTSCGEALARATCTMRPSTGVLTFLTLPLLALSLEDL